MVHGLQARHAAEGHSTIWQVAAAEAAVLTVVDCAQDD
jgi:hypothetical protein